MLEPAPVHFLETGPLPRPSESDRAELQTLAGALPPELRETLRARPDWEELVEIVLDLGRVPEVRLATRTEPLLERAVVPADLDYVVNAIGQFTADNRAGISGTLHRFSAIRNRSGRIVGLTIRRGRALLDTTHIIADIVASGRSLLLLGPPGVGKTTMLREMARVLAIDLDRRVVVVDTSNEIAGDGDVPHAGIGRARRMQVAEPDLQHRVMIEAVENHMPEVIVVDEIGTDLETQAARTIAERGVQLIATAHGQTLENVLLNPMLSDLVGGIESVTLGDEEARRRGTQKTVLERRAPPTFQTLIEMHSRDSFVIHHEVDVTVDSMLRGELAQAETRLRLPDGRIVRETAGDAEPDGRAGSGQSLRRSEAQEPETGVVRIMPFGVSRNRFDHAIASTAAGGARLVRNLSDADVVVTSRSLYRRRSRLLRDAEARGTPVFVLRSNTVIQMEACLVDLLETRVEMDARDEGADNFEGRARRAVAPRLPGIEAHRRLRLTLYGRGQR